MNTTRVYDFETIVRIRDIDFLSTRANAGIRWIGAQFTFGEKNEVPYFDPHFKPRKSGANNGIIVCQVYDRTMTEDGLLGTGIVVCSPDDKWEPEKFLNLSLSRGLDNTDFRSDGETRKLLHDLLNAKISHARKTGQSERLWGSSS